MALCGVKFKAHPTHEQKRVLSQWMGAGRFIYNAKVAEHEYFRTFKAHSLALVGVPVPVDQCYAQFKTEQTLWLKDIPSQVLRNAAYRWREAYQRHLVGLAERPVRKRKGNRDSVWLTSELFELNPQRDEQTGDVTGYQLVIGTKTNQIGALSFDARREFQSPNSITVSRRNGEYFVSFNYEDGQEVATEEELQAEYSQMDEASLDPITVGLDRGVVIPVYPSEGEPFEFTPEQKHTLDHCDRHINRQQKRLSRQVKGSRRRERTRRKLARYHARKADVRRDFAHQTSHRLATSDHQIFVVEDLKIKNMTASPTPQPTADGSGYEPNGATAKAGLNRSILAVAWGMVVTFLKYKALRRRKLVISVSPHQSSQECVRSVYPKWDFPRDG